MKFHVAPLPSCSGTRMSESLCRCTFYLRLKLLATKLHHLFQITKSVFGRLPNFLINDLKREISVAGTSNVYVAVFIIVSPFFSANIRVFDETTKFLEEFLLLALISHRSHRFAQILDLCGLGD